jgi:hypothetical protein
MALEAGSGKSQSAHTLPRTFNADDGPTVVAAGAMAAPMDCTFRPRAISFLRVNHGHQLEVSPAFEQLIWNDTWH